MNLDLLFSKRVQTIKITITEGMLSDHRYCLGEESDMPEVVGLFAVAFHDDPVFGVMIRGSGTGCGV